MNNLEYKGYYGSIEYNKEEKCLYGKVLGMAKDLISYEGITVEELENDFKAGIDSYLEGCAELGIKPRKGYNGVFNVRIPPAIHSRIAIFAETHGTSINAVVREKLEREFAL
ncbi:MAG: type II toxin-antitoxin system HicB family antitoxin [Bacteroidetes bacterium]|nr:type II toxin-antitoxin system HicB family antitoxin [Bacteroidota bacterium]